MKLSKSGPKLFLLVCLSVMGSAIPFVVAAPLLRVVYSNISKKLFWSIFLGISALLFLAESVPLAISLLGTAVSVGVFSYLIDRMKSMFGAFWISVLSTSALTVAATQQWLMSKGSTLTREVQSQVEEITKQALQMNPALPSDFSQTLINMAPSALVSVVILGLGLSLILETSVSRLFQFELQPPKIDLLQFKLPDAYIWIAMFSFLMSFVETGLPGVKVVASNTVNILAILYFFQGLAVTESFFRRIRLGFFIRLMTYGVFLFQLFPLVVALGVVDFWVEFRKRFVRIRYNS